MISLLKLIPGKVVEMVAGKGRLFIEYAMIAGLVTLGGFTVAMWSQKTKLRADLAEVRTSLVTTQVQVSTLKTVTEIQASTIGDLQNLRSQDNLALQGLMTDYKLLTDQDVKVRSRLNDLERKDEPTRNYMSTPVPAKLRCLLEPGTCPAGN